MRRLSSSNLFPEENLKKLGIALPAAPAPAGNYVPCARQGRLIFVSGQIPLRDGALIFKGRVGAQVSLEQATDCARTASLNAVAALSAQLGGNLRAVSRIVKVTVYVASADGFTAQAEVADGASDFFADVFGEKGRHARAAVGVSDLPLGAPVEVEVIAERECCS